MHESLMGKPSDVPTLIHLVQRYEWDVDSIADEAGQFAVRAALGGHALPHNAATAKALTLALRDRSEQEQD